jgi:hypothetical protein
MLFEGLAEVSKHDLHLPSTDTHCGAYIGTLVGVGGRFLAIGVGGIRRTLLAGTRLGGRGEVHVELGGRGPGRVWVENTAKRLDQVASPCPGLTDDKSVVFWSQLQVPPSAERRDMQLPNTHTAG